MLYGSVLWILPEVNRYAKVEFSGDMNWFAYKQTSDFFLKITGREIPFEKTSILTDREAMLRTNFSQIYNRKTEGGILLRHHTHASKDKQVRLDSELGVLFFIQHYHSESV